MYNFTVLALSDVATEAGIEIVFQSFAEFYHELTPKHKKKSKLIFIDKGGYALPAIRLAEQLEIQAVVQVLNWKRIDYIKSAYESASLLLLPAKSKTESIIVDALSKGVPVLSYLEKEQEQYIDHTCGTLIDYYSKGQSIEEFANVMQMLYFDPEACKLLKKGAISKYKNQINWTEPSGRLLSKVVASS